MKPTLCLTTGLATLMVAAVPLLAQDNVPAQPEETLAIAEGNQSVTATEFMVATAHPLATQAGYAVLETGGSAADAAVAVQLMLGLVEPQSSGLGGGAFYLHYDAETGDLTTYDGRERAPLAADEDYWLTDAGEPMEFMAAVIGGRSAGVPGTPMLLEALHEDHGALEWASLFEDALAAARDGFEVTPRMADSVAGADGLELFEETAAYFLPGGEPIAAGTLLQNPQYAATLETFAAEGAAPFYTGQLAEDIVAAVQTDTNPGILTMEDMEAYTVVEREPVCLDYRGYEVCGMGPPSSGGLTVGQILGILEDFDLPSLGDTPEAWHLFVEANQLAFADRNLYMADSDFVDMPQGLLDRDYLASRAALIDPAAANGVEEAGTPPWDEAMLLAPDTERPRAGTTHFVIVDGEGNMVSATTTIESGFGNRVMVNGYLLNNELTDFSFAPLAGNMPVANRVEPGKRPRSSMAPTIVLEDGAPVLLTGSPGGSNIISYTAQSIVAILDFGMDPQDAIDLPHIINGNAETTRVEEGAFGDAVAEGLTALGHAVERANLNSGMHVIQITPDGLVGAADIRREGTVMGR